MKVSQLTRPTIAVMRFCESSRRFLNGAFQRHHTEPPCLSIKRRLLSASRSHADAPSTANMHAKAAYGVSVEGCANDGPADAISGVYLGEAFQKAKM